ncbi:hypothetical protein LG3211_0957 [Lysobacter gummosus]|nr:hypothetical protein LG3211_0957 [Lysobacter gummosus]
MWQRITYFECGGGSGRRKYAVTACAVGGCPVQAGKGCAGMRGRDAGAAESRIALQVYSRRALEVAGKRAWASFVGGRPFVGGSFSPDAFRSDLGEVSGDLSQRHRG